MGYYSRLDGEIAIDPPLTWSEVKDSPYLIGGSSVRLRVEEERTETEDGEHVTRRAVAIEDRYDGEGVKHYAVADELAAISGMWSDRTYSGYLIRVGESAGDVERYRITTSGQVVSELAALVWPDGSPVVVVT